MLSKARKQGKDLAVPTVSLYIHWPFCLSKCPYCDFNSHVAKTIDQKRWLDAYVKELRWAAARWSVRPILRSLFFGGGTPSLMAPYVVAGIIEEAGLLFQKNESCEVTLEANPSTFERGRFQDFRASGVNRLSLGVQSFDEKALVFLGRRHSAEEAKEAIHASQKIFPRVSFDLIYGLKDQNLEDWRAQLREAGAFAPSHVSCYQLTFEPGTAFYTRFKRQELSYPTDDLAVAFDKETEAFWDTRGLHRYEVSNYAAPGEESCHNLAYWESAQTVGIGPGAHGRPHIAGVRHREVRHRAPEVWLTAVEKDGHGSKESVPLSQEACLEEWLMMGLRLTKGVRTEDAEEVTGRSWKSWGLEEKVACLRREGLVCIKKGALWVTQQGRLRLNSVLSFIFSS